MSEFHAIVGLHNLRRLDLLLAARLERARCFRKKIERETSFCVTCWPDNVVHTFKDFTILMPGEVGTGRRERLMQALIECGIETRAYFYPPVHEQAFFRRFATRPLPRTECLSSRVITLPFYSTLTEEEMDYMVAALRKIEVDIA